MSDGQQLAREQALRVAEVVRQACWSAAVAASQQAGISGLCAEGRLELALDAVRSVDLAAVLASQESPPLPNDAPGRGTP